MMRLHKVTAAGVFVLAFAWSVAAAATEVTRVVSPGGIEAWLVEAHAIPILSVDIAFRGGAALDPEGKEGLGNMVSGLLDEGAGTLDSQAFQAQLEDLAIDLRFDAGMDTFSGHLKTLTRNRDTAFELLRLALTEPRFDDEPVARIRRQILVNLSRRAMDPDYIVRRTWYKTAFPDHPYGRPADGTEESVAAITVDDLRAYVRAEIARDRMVVGVVGDITPERLATLLDETFGGLPERGAELATPHAEPAAPGRLIVVERDFPQSVVVFGQRGIARKDPDYYAAYVMNHILGSGGFTSRLTKEVREKRGLAYGVYTYLQPLDHAELMIGRVATQNGRVAESIDIIRREIARLRDEGASADELADAKTYLTGSFALRLDTNDKIAGLLVGIQLEDLGIDYIDRRNDYIEAVTRDDVNRLARTLLKPEDLEIVVVGKPAGLEATN
ncbi:MAG: M16 family metallopeptidase [Alphaproteobacteria bacterium]